MEAGRVASQEPVEEVDAMVTDEVDALVPRRQGAMLVGLRPGQPDDPQRVGDPIGVAASSRCGDRVLGQGERLIDSAGRLETVEVCGDGVCPRRSWKRCDLARQLDIGVEIAAVDLPEGLDERGVSRLARIVARCLF